MIMSLNSMRLTLLAGAAAIALAGLPALAADQAANPTLQTENGITTAGKLVQSQPVGNDGGAQVTAEPAHEWPMPPEETKQIQQALNKNGAKLEANGVFDETTRKALRDFQSSHGL